MVEPRTDVAAAVERLMEAVESSTVVRFQTVALDIRLVLARLRALEAERDDAKQSREIAVCTVEEVRAERDALLAEVARLKDALASHAIQCPQVMGQGPKPASMLPRQEAKP